MACKICIHDQRTEIEQALSTRSLVVDGERESMKDIAARFDVKEQELQIHALTHKFQIPQSYQSATSTNGSPIKEQSKPASFTDAIEYREAYRLREVLADNMATMQKTGEVIRKAANDHDSETNPSLYQVPKQIVELYKFCSENAMDAVEKLARINNLIGNDQDDGTKALGQLALAIQSSVQTIPVLQDTSSHSQTSQDEEDK